MWDISGTDNIPHNTNDCLSAYSRLFSVGIWSTVKNWLKKKSTVPSWLKVDFQQTMNQLWVDYLLAIIDYVLIDCKLI